GLVRGDRQRYPIHRQPSGQAARTGLLYVELGQILGRLGLRRSAGCRRRGFRADRLKPGFQFLLRAGLVADVFPIAFLSCHVLLQPVFSHPWRRRGDLHGRHAGFRHQVQRTTSWPPNVLSTAPPSFQLTPPVSDQPPFCTPMPSSSWPVVPSASTLPASVGSPLTMKLLRPSDSCMALRLP